jgi:predicted PhzF superfamily epimerase YddE/YHI9
MLGSAEQVLSLKPDAELLKGLDIGVVGPRGKVGVIGATEQETELFEVRAFFPGNQGLVEDLGSGAGHAHHLFHCFRGNALAQQLPAAVQVAGPQPGGLHQGIEREE